MQNGHVESFNGRLRGECLNANWFISLTHARRTIEHWRDDCNRIRPHSSLNYRARVEFAALLSHGCSPTEDHGETLPLTGLTFGAYMDPARIARVLVSAYWKRLRAYIRPRS